jgi:peptidoglycan-associated lipoprotein
MLNRSMTSKPVLIKAVQVSLVAALIGVGACSTKKKDLPPPPPPASEPVVPLTASTPTQVPPPAGVQSTSIPGSTADFVAQAGSDTVYFGYDSYELDDPSRTILGKQAEWLARYPNITVTIEGHTDDRGTREYNLALGDRRANAAKNFLAAQGVDASRITTISYGKERPAVDGSGEDVWAKNRRAVTILVGAKG